MFLRLGTFWGFGCFGFGTFWSMGRFEAWYACLGDLLDLGRFETETFRLGTLCLGTFCPWTFCRSALNLTSETGQMCKIFGNWNDKLYLHGIPQHDWLWLFLHPCYCTVCMCWPVCCINVNDNIRIHVRKELQELVRGGIRNKLDYWNKKITVKARKVLIIQLFFVYPVSIRIHFSQHSNYCLMAVANSSAAMVVVRVSSKQSNFFFGSNRNELKLNLFRLFFGLFRETKQIFFRFVSVFRSGIEITETNRNKPKKSPKNKSLLGGPRNN